MGDTTYDYRGKKVLITGASRGLGRTIALAFAEAGCSIAATGRDEIELRNLSDQVRRIGGVCETYPAELSSAEEFIAMAEHFLRTLLNGVTKVMAVEWGKYNIRVNAVAPTIVLAELGQRVWGDPEKGDPIKERIPLRRFAQPEEITKVVLFLAVDGVSMINGEVIIVDGGGNAQLY
jgi:NAD(P)-dependent dehydrogenase (short-subunit alcohol dehydrogenase family)